ASCRVHELTAEPARSPALKRGSVVAGPFDPVRADAFDMHEVGVLIGGFIRCELDLDLVQFQRLPATWFRLIAAYPHDPRVTAVETRQRRLLWRWIGRDGYRARAVINHPFDQLEELTLNLLGEGSGLR